MKDFWIKLSPRIKQSERLRFNHILNKVEGLEPIRDKVEELENRIVALEDKLGYKITLTETNGLTGVTVKLNSTDVTEIGEGVYSIENITPGTYTLSATLEGYEDYSEEIAIDSQHTDFSFTLEVTPETEE